MTITSSFMLHVATALLPPHDKIDYEYYDVLNLSKRKSRSITTQQIRKAYKVLSLQLHPDKVIQRNGNVEEAAILYEKVQEAVAVLSDEPKRQVYINYNFSVARYKFMTEQHGLFNVMQVLQNLRQSSCIHRTKLWLFVLMFTLVLLLLQPISIAMKVNSITNTTAIPAVRQLNDTSWFLILIPFFIFSGLFIVLRIMLLIYSLRERFKYGPPNKLPKATYYSVLGLGSSFDPEDDDDESDDEHENSNSNSNHNSNINDDITDKDKKKSGGPPNSELIALFMSCCIPITIVVGIMFLVLQWEDMSSSSSTNGNNSDWIKTAAILFYCTIACIVIRHVISLQQIRYVTSCMISNTNGIVVVSSLSNSNNFRYIDNDDENPMQQQQHKQILQQKYLIVEPDPEKLAITLEVVRQMKQLYHREEEEEDEEQQTTITDEEMEYVRVQCSEEYQILERLKKEYYQKIGAIVVIYVTQLTLIYCQIQHTISASSWYIIFIPLLIYYGMPIFTYCCYCCCSTDPSIVIPHQQPVSVNHSTTTAPTTAATDSTNVDMTTMDNTMNDIENHGGGTSEVASSSDTVVASKIALATEGENNKQVSAVTNSALDKDNIVVTAASQSSVPTDDSNNYNKDTTNTTSTPSPEETHDHDNSNDDGAYFNQTLDPDEERERAQRSANCCSSCFVIILLCLIIAKIQQSYGTSRDDNNNSNENDDDGSFNTMWILFPLFLLSGCLVCLFTLCICISPAIPDELDDTDTKVTQPPTSTTTATNTTATSTLPVPSTSDSNHATMIIPPPLTTSIELDSTSAAVIHSAATTTSATTSVGGTGHTSGSSNIDDLD